MQAREGLRHRLQDFRPARAAAAAPPVGPPSPPSTLEWLPSALEWLKSAFTQLGPLLGGPARDAPGAAAAAARAAADAPRPPPADSAEVRRTWAGVARSLDVAVRDPADYMERSSYGSASVLLQAKDGTLLPAHFAMVQQPRFQRSAECAWAEERFDPEQPLLLQLPFARFATADVALLLRWIYKRHEPSDRPFGRGGATEEFKELAALFVEDDVAAAWWDQAGEVDSLGGAVKA
jgi:hypothetical protein